MCILHIDRSKSRYASAYVAALLLTFLSAYSFRSDFLTTLQTSEKAPVPSISEKTHTEKTLASDTTIQINEPTQLIENGEVCHAATLSGHYCSRFVAFLAVIDNLLAVFVLDSSNHLPSNLLFDLMKYVSALYLLLPICSIIICLFDS